MDTFSKNKLQEICQAKKLPLPKYVTTDIGDSYKHVWLSIVTVFDQEFEGNECSSKSGAEMSAAYAALNHENGKVIAIKRKFENLTSPKSTILLIDVENLQTFIKEENIYKLLNVEKLEIHAFVGKYSPLVGLLEKAHASIVKHISPSPAKDGTDTFIQMFVGVLLAERRYQNYIIATRDHFAVAMRDIILDRDFSAEIALDQDSVLEMLGL